MKHTLYSLRTHVNLLGTTSQYYITKFVDGEVESAYVCTENGECECPAGQRPSCRHRQMLPMMLASGIVNTHWFWDFDRGIVVDFEGTSKTMIDNLAKGYEQKERWDGELPIIEGELAKPRDEYLEGIMNRDRPLNPKPILITNPAKSWRRF